MATEIEQVRALTSFLTEKSGYGGREDSPIQNMVKAQISALTRDIAAEVVRENPELGVKIREMVQRVVTAALAENEYLTRAVIDAVAKALADRARELEEL